MQPAAETLSILATCSGRLSYGYTIDHTALVNHTGPSQVLLCILHCAVVCCAAPDGFLCAGGQHKACSRKDTGGVGGLWPAPTGCNEPWPVSS
jgi:hypothetical protein